MGQCEQKVLLPTLLTDSPMSVGVSSCCHVFPSQVLPNKPAMHVIAYVQLLLRLCSEGMSDASAPTFAGGVPKVCPMPHGHNLERRCCLLFCSLGSAFVQGRPVVGEPFVHHVTQYPASRLA